MFPFSCLPSKPTLLRPLNSSVDPCPRPAAINLGNRAIMAVVLYRLRLALPRSRSLSFEFNLSTNILWYLYSGLTRRPSLFSHLSFNSRLRLNYFWVLTLCLVEGKRKENWHKGKKTPISRCFPLFGTSFETKERRIFCRAHTKFVSSQNGKKRNEKFQIYLKSHSFHEFLLVNSVKKITLMCTHQLNLMNFTGIGLTN